MTASFVVDTNVAVVANGKAPQASPSCVLACVDALSRIRSAGRVVLDTSLLILDEYRRQLSPSGQPGLGDAFYKWVWQNQGNPDCCEWVDIHQRRGAAEDFEEFPRDPALCQFDRDDRKFVAVVRASPSKPPVLNAVDSDWWTFRTILARYGVEVEFVCRDQFPRRPKTKGGRRS
jgi:hypothetical protein